MANKKISELDALGTAPAGTDILPITDVSGTATTKKVTVTELLTNAPDNSTDVTLATVANNYLSISSQEITAGTVPVALGGTGGTTAAAARTNLGVDASGTDNSTNVTLASVASNYLSLSNQEITAGTVPVVLGGTGGTDASTARTNLGLGTAATKDTGTSNGNVVELDSTGLPAVDGSRLTNLPEPDVDGAVTTALRGTDNPHIGAFPNQSFKVTDNPYKSVMVIADEDGNLTFLVNSDTASIKLKRPTGSALSASFGFSVNEDSTEPDIEVEGTLGGATENYSVISGDSDTKGPNELPIRQGFNLPDIGANPAPILISGGSIA